MAGKFDKVSIKRGFQVYREICSNCHSMRLVTYRTLEEIGFSEEEVKAIAAEKKVKDGPNDRGEMFERAALPSDFFVSPFSNEQEARASNNGALPPDLSLIVKARHNGPNYIYSLLNSYGSRAPAQVTVPSGKYYDPIFPGGVISMPSPLQEGAVTYSDGTKATVDQMARDVISFLQWAAEPEMEKRKSMGIHVLLFLGVMTILLVMAKQKIWSRIDK
jgi:ubiquinol-cytochrome c reductase cytochrome c1 subunit